MERIISAVKLTGQSKRTVSDIFKTGNGTGTIRNHGETGVLVTAGAEVRQELYTFQRIVGRIVTDAAGRHADRKAHIIDVILNGEAEKCRSRRGIDVIEHFVHFFDFGIIVVVCTLDVAFQFKHFAVTDTGIQNVNGVFFGNRPL